MTVAARRRAGGAWSGSLRCIIAVASAMMLAGCSTIGGWFDDDEELKPAELVDFSPDLSVDRVWSVDVGGSDELPLAGLRPAPVSDRVYLAGAAGEVVAVERESGRTVWSIDVETMLGGGPGVGDDIVAVGTMNGEVIGIDRATGVERWRAGASSEILSPPAVADGIVVVRSQDGRVFGFDAESGERIWVYDQSVPLLSLRGTGEPLVQAGFAYLGFDNGRIAALRISDGTVIWEQLVSAPQGRTELERIVDIDGSMVLVASDLYAVTYQGLLAGLTANSGRILWVKDMSSSGGVAVSRTKLSVADADDAVWAVDRLSGGTLWKQDALIRREVSAPAFHGDAVVVGDFEGYLHWMSDDDGRFIARSRASSAPVITQPVRAGNLLLVQTQDGRVVAFRAG